MTETSRDQTPGERPRPSLRAKLGFFRWGIRWLDLPIFNAFPTMGALLAIEAWDFSTLKRFALFIVSTYCFSIHVYIFNDWSDGTLNPDEPSLRVRHALKHPVFTGAEVLGISWFFLVAALAGYLLLTPSLLVVALVLTVFTILYSHPRFNLKGRPVFSTVAHFLVASCFFLGGWIAFGEVTALGLALALYFGLVLAGGNYSNEIEDFNQDFAAGRRTNAIAFGQRVMFRVGLALFVASSVLLVAISFLWMDGLFSRFVAFCVLYFWIYEVWRYRGWKGGDSIKAFRTEYRLAYATLCLALLLGRGVEWLEKWGATS